MVINTFKDKILLQPLGECRRVLRYSNNRIFIGVSECILYSQCRCYSLALGHLRRILDHNNLTYKLLGTILSNRAACFLDLNTQRLICVKFMPGTQLMTVLLRSKAAGHLHLCRNLSLTNFASDLIKQLQASTHLTKGTFQWQMCYFQLQIR